MDIYVGNLAYSVTDADLTAAFSAHGEVSQAKVVTDRESGRSKGFGFVTMTNSDEAKQAIEALNDQELQGRPLKISEARPREERAPRGPRREGGFNSRGPRREGGFNSRGPRREGGFGGGREGGYGNNY